MSNDLHDFVQRAKVLIVRRQFQEAAKVCRLGLLAQPQLIEGRLVLGMALMAMGRFEEVLGEMRVALDMDDRSPLAWLLRGEALSLKGDYAQAEKVLLRAKELDPSNEKADKLLADIRTALAAGLEGESEEPPETKEYPAKLREQAEPGSDQHTSPAERLPALPMIGDDDAEPTNSTERELVPRKADQETGVGTPPEGTNERALLAAEPDTSRTPLPSPADAFAEETFVDDGSLLEEESTLDDEDAGGTEPRAELPEPQWKESSYEEPAIDDYAEAPRRFGPSNGRAAHPATPQPPRLPQAIPTPGVARFIPRAGRPSQPQPLDESAGAPRVPLTPPGGTSGDGIEPGSHEVPLLSSKDVEFLEEGTVPARPGTHPPVEEPPPAVRVAAKARSTGARPIVSGDAPPRTTGSRGAVAADGRAPRSTGSRAVVPPIDAPRPEETPLHVRPARAMAASAPTRPMVAAQTKPILSPEFLPESSGPTIPRRRSLRDLGTVISRRPFQLASRRTLLLIGGAFAAVMTVAAITGVALREYRVRARVERHRENARQRLAAGTYYGYQAAADEYRKVLADRPSDDAARATRARLLAAMTFEFGDPVDPAARAVSALGDDANEDAQLARVYVALAKGDLARARRLASAAEGQWPDALPRYLLGRTELLLDRPDDAVGSISSAVERDPRDPLLLHGLGLAEAARRRDSSAMDAFARALELSPNHVGTLVDRAALQILRGRDTGQAKSYLEGVVSKLSADASPAELGRAYLALGQLYLAQGDLDAGRAMLVRASTKRPEGDVALSEGLAAAYLQAFELDAAEAEARRAIEAAHGRNAAYLTLAQVALERGRAQEALSDVEQAGTAKPEALLVRGRAYLALGKNAIARNDLDAAVRLAPDLHEARVARCLVDIADGRPQSAQQELLRMERARQAPAQVAEALAKSLLALKQPDRAGYWFKKAIERNPLALGARLELARLYAEADRTDDARAELKHAVEANAEFAPAWRELAALSLESNDLLAARDEYDILVEKSPADSAALLGSAHARLLLGDATGAEERIVRAERFGATGEEVADLRGMVYLRSGKPDAAIKLLAPMLPTAQRGETASLWVEAAAQSGHPLSPRQIGLAVPARLRATPEVQAVLARALVEEGRSARAEAMAVAILRRSERTHLQPTVRAEAYAIIGRALFDEGQIRESARNLDQAIKLDPHNARALYQLSVLLDERRDHDEALKLMEQAARADPLFPDAQYELGRLRAQSGDVTAADAFQAYLKLEPAGAYASEAKRALGMEEPPPPPKPKRLKRRRFR